MDVDAVLAGSVVQGVANPGDGYVFLATHIDMSLSTGNVLAAENIMRESMARIG